VGRMTALDDLRFETRFRACSIHPPIAPPRMRRPNAATANRSVKPADDENLKQKPLDRLQKVSSWCRVVEGSGQRHVITARGSKLIEGGFV
jgi:hypothetical protein